MFEETLETSLVLTIQDTPYTIGSGEISSFDVQLYNYGFFAKVQFWVTSDKATDSVFTPFTTQDLIKAVFVAKGYYNLPDVPPAPVSITGLVYDKGVEEFTYDGVEDKPVLHRLYTISFADPAWVLWKQHFPCELFTEKSMKDIVEAHKGDQITITYDLEAFTTTYPILMVGLGVPSNQASFYDFVLWMVSRCNGVWNYDNQLNAYKISSAKDTSLLMKPIDRDEVHSWKIHFPETIRHKVNVLNSYTEATKNQEIDNDQAVTGIRRDVLLRTSLEAEVTSQVQLETNRLKYRQNEVEIELKQFPTIDFYPGCFVGFEGGLWSTKIFLLGKQYRIYEIFMRGDTLDTVPPAKWGNPKNAYRMKMVSRLEIKEEEIVNLPSYKAPYYPIYVEGKMVSEAGETTQETYQIYQQESTSLDIYKIHIPLWTDQKVIVHFTANLLPGHFYFPYFKEARVLLAFEFDKAWVKRFLNWRPGARLPQDGQGNHLLLGLTHEGQTLSQTSIQHYYADSQPLLQIKRIREKDTQTVQIKEGYMMLEVKQEE